MNSHNLYYILVFLSKFLKQNSRYLSFKNINHRASTHITGSKLSEGSYQWLIRRMHEICIYAQKSSTFLEIINP